MRSGLRFATLILMAWAVLTVICTEAFACNAATPASLASYTVKNADAIVRAAAIEFIEEKGVKLRVEEILKGKDIPSTLIFKGYLTDRDDFNSRPVPYDHVRAAGAGPCYAYEYKHQAEYLLLLKRKDGELTPYWQPLAPTNEQLRSPNDEWLKWVKENLGVHEKQDAKVGSMLIWLPNFFAGAT